MYDESVAEEMKPNKAEEFIAKKTGKKLHGCGDLFCGGDGRAACGRACFSCLPNVLTGLIANWYVNHPTMMNVIDGVVRLAIFLIYLIRDYPAARYQKRMFAYHGAEHKVINCYEHECEMNVENAQKFTTRHPSVAVRAICFW